MMRYPPQELKTSLLQKSKSGHPILFQRVTPNLVTSQNDSAAADLLLVDHLSSAERPNPAAQLLPLGNANEEMLRNASQFRDVIREHDVIAGVCGTDPFRMPEKLLLELKGIGVVGVQNTPSIGMIDGSFRKHLENSRISYAQEVALLQVARQLGLFTIGTVFSESDAKAMLAAGVDAIAVHPGIKGLLSKTSSPSAQLLRALRSCYGNASHGTVFLETASS